MTDCCCGNAEGTNKECERCRLIETIENLKSDIFQLNDQVSQLRYFYRCTKHLCIDCGNDRGNETSHWCNACLAEQKRNDAMERGDEMRDRAKDEKQ